ncbi:hypothetical protein [Arthrobacter sp. Edens01]|uniref:hypothetical protein n=1 Tax=Arthrobacter sp. Edens01 TaxID=1732020 RepID=UPI00128ED5B1|nr:hypothetical protein [Arthrobacter sp. Edens01]
MPQLAGRTGALDHVPYGTELFQDACHHRVKLIIFLPAVVDVSTFGEQAHQLVTADIGEVRPGRHRGNALLPAPAGRGTLQRGVCLKREMQDGIRPASAFPAGP